ncbi:DNA translocase FtsK 4TM domain-containing protein [Olsenella sp. DSM 107455]|uniref:DNA translocase FtsK 4TM domain-containing protein n=1 Tax=Thermophilibacter gallinarum TaxID=2779357 RepID=A0ABR9QU76_9ACTN|nr:DNA translocase FtsK [Thermophilibacter gallinarum]MBE5024630.1 DNA translocase FtsK 4TM domain-containing protein [Thermophilibacter gallinarum]
MPANRTSNAAKKGSSKSRSRSAAARAGSGVLVGTVRGDIVGIVLVVVACALLAALLVPSTAVVTSAVRDFLALSFGVAAALVPCAVLAFACTFFVDGEQGLPGRIALGLGLVVIAILAMVSLNAPASAASPESVFDPEVARATGGYVGGALAWALLTLLGTVVGNILLVGVILAGVVVCGFSVSGAVSHARERLSAAAAAHDQRVRERREREIIDAAADEDLVAAPAQSLFDAPAPEEEGATTFIGNRKTTVLKRGTRGRAQGRAALLDPVQEVAPTAALEHVAAPEPNAEAASDASAVPAFLGAAAKKGKGRAKKDQKAAPKEPPATLSRPGDGDETYRLPPLSILRENPDAGASFTGDAELRATAERLQGTLEEFGLTSRVAGWIAGPSVTTFKISMGEGERVSKIVNLEDDIALSLAAKSVRIFAPIPGTSLVGIEIPNEKPQPVFLSDVLPYATGGPLDCAFGRDSEGRPIVVDLAGLPHLLVAGTTGSGKSVLLNAIIMSMLMRATPEQVRLIMVDPKRVEFTGYAGLPHLYVPVVTEPRQAASALQWGVTEMERRLKVFEHYKVRDIKTFNKNVDGEKYADMENPPKHMPYFVIVIDELADLMMVAGKDVESSIVRIAQLGRAAGIHLIVATQRPSADVVTGLIRANIDNRVALSVDNSINSRIILDQKGAEQLLGKGDMLVKLRGKKPRRAQGCWVSDEEIEKTVAFIRDQVVADYHEDILTAVVPNSPGGAEGGARSDDDPLIWEAARIVVDSQLGSTSGLQRALSVGYARAGRIMDMLEAKGVVGPANGSKPREVLLDKDGLEELRVAEETYREVE